MNIAANRASILAFVAGLAALAGCGSGNDVGAPAPPPPAPTYTVGGTVSGLNGSLALSNGGATTTLAVNGAFTLPGALAAGATYAVTIASQPANQQCTLANGSGTIAAANVSSVTVTCTTFRVTATIGTAGGTLTHPSGAAIIIPAGALAQDTVIGIGTPSSGWPLPLAPDSTASGSVFEFTPHDVLFRKPVRIQLPAPASPSLPPVFVNSFGQGWQAVEIARNGSVIEYERNTLSWHYLGVVLCAGSGGTPDPYACQFPSGFSFPTATPARSIMLTSGASGLLNNASSAAGSAGTWDVDGSTLTSLQLTLNYTAANDCANPHVVLRRLGSTQPLADVQAPLAGGAGSSTLTVPRNSLVDGVNVYFFGFYCTRPGKAETGGGDWITFNVSPNALNSFSIGGSVTGLTQAGLTLQNGTREVLAIAPGATSFAFATPQSTGTAYNLRVRTQPSGQNCTVANGTGVANANVGNVSVTCTGGPTPGGLVIAANSGSSSLSIFRRDASSGALSPLGSVGSDAQPFRVVLTPDSRYAYVTNSTGNSVTAFSVDITAGTLTAIPQGSVATTNPVGIAVDPQGRFIWVVNRSANLISQFAINPGTGALSAVGTPTATRSQPFGIAVNPASTALFVSHVFDNSASAYSLNATTGQPSLIGSLVNSLLVPHDITVDPSGRFAYVAEVNDRAIAQFRIDQTTGALTANGFASLGSGFGESVVVHPNGKFLYASNRATPGGVFVFSINQTTGVLTQLGAQVGTGGDQCGALALNSAGTLLYVTNNASGTVSTFSVDPATGAISRLGTPVSTGASPEGIAVTP